MEELNMNLGEFRELTKDLNDITEMQVFLGTSYKDGDVIEREEFYADIENVDIDEDDQGNPILFLLDC